MYHFVSFQYQNAKCRKFYYLLLLTGQESFKYQSLFLRATDSDNNHNNKDSILSSNAIEYKNNHDNIIIIIIVISCHYCKAILPCS